MFVNETNNDNNNNRDDNEDGGVDMYPSRLIFFRVIQ